MSDNFLLDHIPFWGIEFMFSPIFTIISGSIMLIILGALYAMGGDPKKGFVRNFIDSSLSGVVVLIFIGVGGTLFNYYVFPGHVDSDRRLEELKALSLKDKVVEINGTKYVPLDQSN